MKRWLQEWTGRGEARGPLLLLAIIVGAALALACMAVFVALR